MDIIVKKTSDYKDFSSISTCEINCIHVKITDFLAVVNDFKNDICDTGWIGKLDALSQKTFNATAKRTIETLVKDIIDNVKSTVNTDIGEYIVSYCAQYALEAHYTHTKIPLAELLKEKVAGNPAFDFHTISSKKIMVFGEAKFSMKKTPRAKALNQIKEFIELEKDYGELNSFRAFLDDEIEKNTIAGNRGFAAAFSLNAKNVDEIFKKALESKVISELIKHTELFLIAIEIC